MRFLRGGRRLLSGRGSGLRRHQGRILLSQTNCVSFGVFLFGACSCDRAGKVRTVFRGSGVSAREDRLRCSACVDTCVRFCFVFVDNRNISTLSSKTLDDLVQLLHSYKVSFGYCLFNRPAGAKLTSRTTVSWSIFVCRFSKIAGSIILSRMCCNRIEVKSR